ncbi:MAG TPA: MFS transporter, partial [Holophaga sp.]|nr:MFS transporter [Holophaga sp.]
MAAGKVSDHLGRRRVLAACMVGSGLLTGACGFLRPSLLVPEVLVAACFSQGAMKPIIAASIMDLCPPEQRKEGFSLSYLGVNLGVAVGPMAAGFLFERHLAWTFFGNALALAGALVLLVKMVPESRASFDALPASERPVQSGALKAFLERPLLVAFCIINLFVYFAYAQTNFGLTLYTAEAFGPRGAAVFGMLMSCNACVVLATTTLFARLTRRLSEPAAMGIGAVLYTVGFGMLAFPLGLHLLVLSTVIWTSGEVLLAINTGAYLGNHTPGNLRGRFQSIREATTSGGRILSPLVFGAIITGAGVRASWLVTALVTLACAAGFAGLHARENRTACEQPGCEG